MGNASLYLTWSIFLFSYLKEFSFPCHLGTCMCLALVADLELQLCASPPCLLRNICQSIWISGQHFSGLHRGLRRLPTVLGLVCKQVQYPHLSHCCLLFFLPTLGFEGCFTPGTELSPSLYLKLSWLYLGSTKKFTFLVKLLLLG